MKSFSLFTTEDNLKADLEGRADGSYDLVIVFAASNLFTENSPIKSLAGLFPNAIVTGCSTAGEIHNDRIADDKISILAIDLEKTLLRRTTADLTDMDASETVGMNVAKALSPDEQGKPLAGVFVLSPGVGVNGSALTEALQTHLPAGIPIGGGLAGDDVNFRTTWILDGGEFHKNKVVGIGFYGEDIVFSVSAGGGWNVFGPARRITSCDKNIVYELDGRPALDLYEEYLGDRAADLPGSGLLYPFAILNEDDRSETGLIRTILDIDREKRSLTFAGDFPPNALICLMHADSDLLVEGAEQAAETAKRALEGKKAAIAVSCVGRKIVMADETEEEVLATHGLLGDDTDMIGFYSYGEIAPYGGRTALHNQTMTLTVLQER